MRERESETERKRKKKRKRKRERESEREMEMCVSVCVCVFVLKSSQFKHVFFLLVGQIVVSTFEHRFNRSLVVDPPPMFAHQLLSLR